MKRLFTLFLSLFVIFLCSCERGNKLTVNTPLNFKEYTYCGITDYANADKLVNDADVILTGTVKNISFKLFDEAMKKEIKNTASKKESLLCTVYTVEVKTVLKGKADGAVDIVVKGGIPDKYEKEQLEAFGEKLWNALNEENKVSLFVRSIDLATGKTDTKIYNKNK